MKSSKNEGSRNQTTHFEKWANDLNREFSEEEIMAKKYLKNCTTTSEMKDMQIKTTLRFHLTPVRMAKNQENNWQVMMVKTWGAGTPSSLSVALQTGIHSGFAVILK